MTRYPAAFETLEGVVRLSGELDFVDPTSQPVLTSATVTLTNAQVLALPTTPVTILPAQGAGKLALAADSGSFPMCFSVNGPAVAYTNVDAAADFFVFNDGVNHSGGWYTKYKIASDLLTYGPPGVGPVVAIANSFGPFGGASIYTNENVANQPIKLQADNGVLGNFTGGNAANTLTVVLLYALVSV